MNILSHRVLKALIVILLMTSPISATAQIQSNRDALVYYQIGGASNYARPPTYRKRTIGGTVTAGFGYSCGNFNLTENIEQLLNSFKNGLDQLDDMLFAAASAAIANLPGYILQKANPALYELFQNAMLRYEELYYLAIKDCQQMEREMARGKDPYEDWIIFGKSGEWGRQAREGATATEAQTAVNEDAGAAGTEWVNGETRGGRGMEPINIIGDTCAAGYDILINGGVVTGGIAPAAPAAEATLTATWENRDEAAEWCQDVLGESTVTIYDDVAPTQTPGSGLLPKIEAEKILIMEVLWQLVRGDIEINAENLKLVSAPNLFVRQEVLESLRDINQDASHFILQIKLERLASEVASYRVINQAMLARRLLLTGVREPHIYSSPTHQHIRSYVIPEINDELRSIVFEDEIRKKMVSSSAVSTINMGSSIGGTRNASSERENAAPIRPASQDGSIKRENP